MVLGWSAFGGPAAHIGVFQKVFVEAKNWMSLTVFNELLSLGQARSISHWSPYDGVRVVNADP